MTEDFVQPVRNLDLRQRGALNGEFLLFGWINERMDCGDRLHIEYVKNHGVVRFCNISGYSKPVFRHEIIVHRSRFHTKPERVYFDNTCQKVSEKLLKLNPGDRVIMTTGRDHSIVGKQTKVYFYVADIPSIDLAADPGIIDDGNRGYCVPQRRDW